LVTGKDPVTGIALTGAMATNAARVQTGMAEVQRTGRLNGKPAILLQGRDDALLPTNNTGRAYFAKNQLEAGNKTVYYEVTNAQHLDVYLAVPSFKLDASRVPLGPYLAQALSVMYAHLKTGGAIPASQVVRTVPRGGTPGSAPAITTANVPRIAATPATADAITFANGTLSIPN
jgi:hydroxybutyrate-dimer hydrolase